MVKTFLSSSHNPWATLTKTWIAWSQKQDRSRAWIWSNRRIIRINYKRKLTDFKALSVPSIIQMKSPHRNLFLTWITTDKWWNWMSINRTTRFRRCSSHKRIRKTRISLLDLSKTSKNYQTRVAPRQTVLRRRQPTKFAAGEISISKVPIWRSNSNQSYKWIHRTFKDLNMSRSNSSNQDRTNSKCNLTKLSKLTKTLLLGRCQFLICKWI